MANSEQKLVKIRTFKDDFLRAQKMRGEVPATTKTEPAPVSSSPSTTTTEAAAKAPATPPVPKPIPTAAPSFDDVVHDTSNKKSNGKRTVSTNITSQVPKATATANIDEDVAAIKSDSKSSILASADSFDATLAAQDDVSEGTIITDQKHTSNSVGAAISEALFGWGKTLAERLGGEEEEVHTVARVDTREEVLKRAATQSAFAPHDDYRQVAQRRETTNTPTTIENNVTITDETAIPTPSWQHLREEVTETEDTPEIEMTTEEVTEENPFERPEAEPKLPVPEPETIVETAPAIDAEPEIAPIPEPVPEVLPEPTPAPEPEIAPIPEPVPEVLPEPTPAPEPEIEEETEPAPVATPELPPLPTAPQPVAQSSAAVSFNLPSLAQTRIRFAAVIVGAIILGVSVSFLLFGSRGGTVSESQLTIESLVRAEERIPVQFTTSPREFMQSLLAISPDPNTRIAQLYPTVVTVEGERVASTNEMLEALNFRIEGSFLRSIETVNFGLYQNRDSFMILRVNSFDNGFSGMLSWEPTMSSDLSPFFGAPVSGSFDPQARTASQVIAPFFVDTVVANHDTRILSNELQEEKLMYSFINRNTIVITTSREALEEIAESLQ